MTPAPVLEGVGVRFDYRKRKWKGWSGKSIMEVQSGTVSDEMESGGNREREEEGSQTLSWGSRTIVGPPTVRRTGRCQKSEKMVSVKFEHDE